MGRFRGLLDKVKDRARGRLGLDDPPASNASAAVPDDWNQAYKGRAGAAAGTVTLRLENLGVTTTVARGTSILDAAIAAGVDLNHYCGGMCSCGSCRIVLIQGEVSPMDAMERATLAVVQESDADRLGCQTALLGGVVVEIPDQD